MVDFVCFVIINPLLLAGRVDLGVFCFINFPISLLPPLPPPALVQKNIFFYRFLFGVSDYSVRDLLSTFTPIFFIYPPPPPQLVSDSPPARNPLEQYDAGAAVMGGYVFNASAEPVQFIVATGGKDS